MKILPIIAGNYCVEKKQNLNFTASMARPVLPLNNTTKTSTISLEIKVRAIYEKLRTQLPKIEIKTIEKILERFNEYPRSEVLMVMNRLTNFSNMSSFVNLSNYFAKEKISNFVRFVDDYRIDTESIIDKSFNKQGGLSLKQPINVNFLFEYFFKPQQGKAPLYIAENRGLVIDSDGLEILKKKDLTSDFFSKCKFLYIKDFENTYNIFNQHKDFELMIKDNLEKLKVLKTQNPKEKVENLLDKIFNPNLEKIKNLGITPIVIDTTQKENITPQSIADNLSPMFPQYTEFKTVLMDSVKALANKPQKQAIFLDLVKQKIEAYSSKTFAKKIEKLKIIIEDSVRNKGKDIDKIYYALPNLNKSFSLMAYLYQKINNIDNSKIIYADLCSLNHAHYYSAIDNELPKGSTLVILDDVAVTGYSLFATQVYYHPNLKKENFDITFATVYATDSANKRFEKIQSQTNKVNDDDFIFSDYQELSYNENMHDSASFFKESLLMLPHIAPDNNMSYFAPVIRLFYPRREFVQEAWNYRSL